MSRDLVSALASAVSNTRAVFLTAGIVLSLSSAAWAQSPAAAHDGLCRVAIVHGQHVQPSPKCHLPPPLAQNPASIENTAPALREEIDRLATHVLGLSAPSVETEGGGRSTAGSEGAGISPPNPLDAHGTGDVRKPSNRDAENLAAQPRQEYAEKRAAAQRTGQ